MAVEAMAQLRRSIHASAPDIEAFQSLSLTHFIRASAEPPYMTAEEIA